MAGVRIAINGTTEALAALHAIAAGLADATPMWDEIGGYVVVKTQNRFEEGKAPDGARWPVSLRAMAGGKTLIDTARLFQSFTHNATATSVEAGTNVIYAAIHQFGGTITAKSPAGLRWSYRTPGGKGRSFARKQSVTIPARPFLGIDAEDEIEIIAIAEGYIARLEGGDGRH